MKTIRLFLVLPLVLGMTSSVFGQTVTEYFVAKAYDLKQTSGAGSTPEATPYGFFAEVFGTGLSGSYTVSTPGGSVSSPQTLTIDGDLAEYDDAIAYADMTALNAAYNNGSYTLSINTSSGLKSPTLDLTGDSFPNTFSITSMTNGSWAGGNLLFNPSQDLTINFDAFTGFDTSSRIKIEVEDGGGYSDTSASAITSFVIPSGSINLVTGQTSTAEILFSQAVDGDSTTISGVPGIAFYGTIVSFTLQAVPEPSTYAVILGALALAVVVLRRRRLS